MPSVARVLLALILCGCSGNAPEQADDKADATMPTEAVAEATAQTENVVLPQCPGMGDLTGAAFTAWELFATAPTDAINEIWAEYVEEHDLVVIFLVTNHDVAGGLIDMQVTSAWAQKSLNEDGTFDAVSYQFALEPGALTLRLSGCQFEVEGEFELDLVVPKINQPFHVYRATGSGSFSPGGEKIEEFNLSGFLLEDEAAQTCLVIPGLGVANLRWFLNLAHTCVDSDVDGDGELDSYNFRGVVRAEDRRELFAPGIHPIGSEIDECIPDVQVCTPRPE